MMPHRRDILVGTVAFGSAIVLARAAVAQIRAHDITLVDFIRAPVLHPFYSEPPQGHVTPTGLGGVNVGGLRLIEDQRGGAEWITRWFITGRQVWRDFGWRMLDIGVAQQQPDGGFGRFGYYHSNSIYLEALARALLLDPAGCKDARMTTLRRGCDWMLVEAHSSLGKKQNAPYTHREYLLASMFGEAGRVLGDASYQSVAAAFAEAGIRRQLPNGQNPEMGGGDVSYQMAGVFFALRYYPYASESLRGKLRTMISAAIEWDLQFITQDGVVDMAGSTRVGRETVLGKTKFADLPTIFQTLSYATVIIPNPNWAKVAHAVAVNDKLPV